MMKKFDNLIEQITDEQVKEQLTEVMRIIEKIEKTEEIDKNVEKITFIINKMKKVLANIDVTKLTPDEKKKLVDNLNKIIAAINKLLQGLLQLSEENKSNNINPSDDTIKNITEKLSNVLENENFVNSIPPQLMDKIKPQLNQLANTTRQLQQLSINKTPQNAQLQQNNQSNLQDILKNVANLMDKINNSNENKIVKNVANTVKKQAIKALNSLEEGKKTKIDSLSNNIEKIEHMVKSEDLKQQMYNVRKELDNAIVNNSINNIQKELQNLQNTLDKVKSGIEKGRIQKTPENLRAIKSLENFLKNPKFSAIQPTMQCVHNSSLPPRIKNNINKLLNNINKEGKNVMDKITKNAIENIRNANSLMSKVKQNSSVPEGVKSELRQAQQQLNQSMLTFNPQQLQQAGQHLNNAMNQIRNSNLSSNDKKKLNQMLNNALNSINQSMQQSQVIKNFNNLNRMPHQMLHQEMIQTGRHQQVRLSDKLDVMQHIIDNVAQMIQQEVQNLNAMLSFSSQQGQIPHQLQGGNYPQSQQALQQLMNQLQSLANSIQQGTASPEDIQQGIQNLQQLRDTPGLSPNINSMLTSVMNSLNNIQSLNQIMQNMNSMSSMLNDASSTIGQILNSVLDNDFRNDLMQEAGAVGEDTMLSGGQVDKKNNSGNRKGNVKIENIINQELIDMLNKLSNSRLSASQRKRFTQLVKELLRIGKETAKKLSMSSDSLHKQEKKALLQSLSNAIKNNLHNVNVDDELLDLAGQFDESLGQDYSTGLSGGMFASAIDDIEKVDINEAMNQLVKMNKEWIQKYKELFEKLIDEIIDLKSKEIGYVISSSGKKIDYRRSIRRTLNNAGIPVIVKKNRDKALGDFIFVLDASGSMYDYLRLKSSSWYETNEIQKRLNKRITQYQTGLITAYVLGEAIKRVGEGDYKIIVFANKMTDLSNASLDVILYLINNPEELNRHIGSGTNLRPTLLKLIKSYLDEDMNVVLFTDTGDDSVWDTFTLTKLKENSMKVGVFCAGEFFKDTAAAFAKAGIPVFSFSSFEELFELMKRYYIADFSPEKAVEEVKEYLEKKKRKGEEIMSMIPSKLD